MSNAKEETYWTQRYQEARTGWNIGYPSTPLKTYIDQLKDKHLRILIPGAGNAYEAEYLHQNGFSNVFILDISPLPLQDFKERNPSFPKDHILLGDFFTHDSHYDLIFEQTFFCSFVPTDANRMAYVEHMAKLLLPKGKLVGLWFNIPLTGDMEKRPFGGDKMLYFNYLKASFKVKVFEESYNSIPERAGSELFGIFIKR
ncbi:methyltransferase domain-containing protein [Spongiimicrobium salis]|uniref:methyltransferase domain-containing protein n=1 Tax=Spongiimicrobium salis TaxID=1667022 RepID=UPI00374CD671